MDKIKKIPIGSVSTLYDPVGVATECQPEIAPWHSPPPNRSAWLPCLPVPRDNVRVSRLSVLNAMLQVTAKGCHESRR